MANTNFLLFILSLIVLGILVSIGCSYIETDSKSIQTGTTVLGAAIVEHEYFFGLMESKYDARIWVMGSNVLSVEGIKESELNWYLSQYLKEDTSSSTKSGVVYYQPTSTPVKISTSGEIRTTKSVAMKCEQSGQQIIVTYLGGEDHYRVTGLKAQWDGSDGQSYSIRYDYPDVGKMFTFKNTEGQDWILVTASFSDGSEQIIFNKDV